MFRTLSVVLVGCFLFASESMAMDADNKTPFSTPKKRKIKHEEEDNNQQNIPLFEPLFDTPTKAEQKFYSPIKRALALKMYKDGKKKSVVSSPDAKRIFSEFDKGIHFTGEMEIRGRRILQSNLFHHDDPVLHEGQWITNLQRMEMGLTPIGRKGILSKEERENLTADEIYKIQSYNRIELHHITQKDTGEDNPIVEMTSSAHHGSKTRLILERDPVTRSVHVIHSRLEKKQVEVLLENHQFSVSNVLHFRGGPSLINREEWNEVRSEYWKARAAEIKKGKEAPSSKAKFFLFHKPMLPSEADLCLPRLIAH